MIRRLLNTFQSVIDHTHDIPSCIDFQEEIATFTPVNENGTAKIY